MLTQNLIDFLANLLTALALLPNQPAKNAKTDTDVIAMMIKECPTNAQIATMKQQTAVSNPYMATSLDKYANLRVFDDGTPGKMDTTVKAVPMQ